MSVLSPLMIQILLQITAVFTCGLRSTVRSLRISIENARICNFPVSPRKALVAKPARKIDLRCLCFPYYTSYISAITVMLTARPLRSRGGRNNGRKEAKFTLHGDTISGRPS